MMAAGSPSGIVALGYRRSLIELRNNLGSLPGHLMFPVIAVVTISIVRHSDALAGRGASFGNYALIGILLINTLLSGVMGAASTVMQERMDGTLLRSSCLPHGTTAYAISKVLSHFQLAVTAFAVALPLLWLVTGRTALSPVSTAALLVVAPAGLLSLLPLAVVVGATLRSPRQLSLASISVMLIGAASGAFHPIAGSGGLTQAGAMTLPTFWVSASLRNALLPESSHSGDPSDLTVLLGGLIVPLIWLVIGISLAPAVAEARPGTRRARAAGAHAERAHRTHEPLVLGRAIKPPRGADADPRRRQDRGASPDERHRHHPSAQQALRRPTGRSRRGPADSRGRRVRVPGTQRRRQIDHDEDAPVPHPPEQREHPDSR